MLAGLKFTLAVPGSQILAEGITQAEVQTAMQELRSSGGGAQSGPHSSAGSGVPATPLMQAAARRLSQEAAVSSSGEAAAARRLAADASAAAALLAEASLTGMSRLSASGQLDPPEPLDVGVAVSLAEACAQVGLLQLCCPGSGWRRRHSTRACVDSPLLSCRRCGAQLTTAWRSRCT